MTNHAEAVACPFSSPRPVSQTRCRRNIDHNALAHPGVGVDPLDIPCLMLTADRDPALRPEFAADMPERCSNLEIHLIENAGHWVQQEQAESTSYLLLEFLGGLG